jgi:uncharacterized protein YkwD
VIGSSRAARVAVGAVAAAAAVLLPAAPVSATAPKHGAAAVSLSPLEAGVLADINAFRRSHHLRPLALSAGLESAARQHSHEMAVDGYFAHDSANGKAFWKRIRRYYPSRSWSLWSVGENLLWSSPGVTAAKALRMWEASPEHRKNLLTARWREIGVSAVHVSAAPGTFHGLAVTVVTTDFGVRR